MNSMTFGLSSFDVHAYDLVQLANFLFITKNQLEYEGMKLLCITIAQNI